MSAVEEKKTSAAIDHRTVQSTVSFRKNDGGGDGGGVGDFGEQDGEDEEKTLMPAKPSARTRVFSVSKDRPITRIPTRVEMKTLTHKAKRPAVDIEFHDLTYAVNTTAGKCLGRPARKTTPGGRIFTPLLLFSYY